MPSPEDVFQKVEDNVLDRVHERFSLLCRNEEDAIRALFLCFAGILRDLRKDKNRRLNDEARFQTINDGLRGLGHCLRWIRKCCPSKLVVPPPQGSQAFTEALELLRWGVKYAPIFGEHSAYRGDLSEVEVDQSAKTITFPPYRTVDSRFFCSQVEAKKVDDRRQERECPEGRLSQLSEAWFNSVRITNRGLHFDDATIGSSGAIDVAVEWMERTCLPELDPSTTVHGCTVADLRRVLASLYTYSLFVTKREDVTDDRPEDGFACESCLVCGTEIDFVRWLADLSDVSTSSVGAIVTTLTFDSANPHVTLAQQPCVRSGNGRIFLLPRMLMAFSCNCQGCTLAL